MAVAILLIIIIPITFAVVTIAGYVGDMSARVSSLSNAVPVGATGLGQWHSTGRRKDRDALA